MKTEEFINQHFDTAQAIHKATEKLGYSKDFARLFTYIHIKLKENEGNVQYFDEDNSVSVTVLEFLLNMKDLKFNELKNKNGMVINKLPKKLHDFDTSFRQNLGMEIRIKSELMNRYRFHTDSVYRKKMINRYKNELLPCIEELKNAA